MTTSENPFTPDRVAKLPFRFPEGITWETLLAKLEGLKYCAAIVGPLGSGKTTLLEGLAPRLEERGFRPVLFRLGSEASMREKERLPEKLRLVKRPEFILLDGAEQLSTRHWLPVRSAATSAAGFVITVHRTSRLPSLFECETNVQLLEALVQELTGAGVPRDEAEDLLSRHHGNMHAVFQEMHARWAGIELN